MAKKNVTIEDVKKAKIGLEKSILDLAKTFEKDYGVKVSYINFERKNDEDEPMSKDRGPLINVDVNMDLDLVY